MDGMVLRDYLSAMDGGDPAKVLELLEPDFSFLIALPGREVTGRSKEDFAAYITGRAAVERLAAFKAKELRLSFRWAMGNVLREARS